MNGLRKCNLKFSQILILLGKMAIFITTSWFNQQETFLITVCDLLPYLSLFVFIINKTQILETFLNFLCRDLVRTWHDLAMAD